MAPKKTWVATLFLSFVAAASAKSAFGRSGAKEERLTTISDAMRMPGTNFCGSGYSAEKFSSLGAFGAADKCCRQHDLGCPAYITPLTAKYGLYNWRMYTVMHCSCDARFRSCLKMASSRTADMVGRMFFNMVQIPCFTFEEADVCTLWTWWGRCKKKERQTTAVLRTAVPY